MVSNIFVIKNDNDVIIEKDLSFSDACTYMRNKFKDLCIHGGIYELGYSALSIKQKRDKKWKTIFEVKLDKSLTFM